MFHAPRGRFFTTLWWRIYMYESFFVTFHSIQTLRLIKVLFGIFKRECKFSEREYFQSFTPQIYSVFLSYFVQIV